MRHALILIILGVSVTLSVVFAAYLVLTKFQPEDEIRRMLVTMSEVDTFDQKTALSWTRDGDERVNTTIYASGQVNMVNISEIEHETRFRVVRLTRDKDYADLSGKVRVLSGYTYLTYKAPGPNVPGVDFDDGETWISFKRGEFPSWGSLLPGIDVPVFTGAPERRSWSPSGITRVREMLRVADVFHVSYADLTEIIDGKNTRIIDARVDPQAARAFLRDIIRAKYQREPTDTERIMVEAQASALEKLTLRLWIGIEDHRLYRLQAAGAVPDGEDNLLIPVDVLFEFSNFNATFVSETPDRRHITTFQELLGATFGILGEGAEASLLSGISRSYVDDEVYSLPSVKVEDGKDPDNDGLDNTLELFYGTNPNNPDTDGDGVSDGDEVFNGKNPRGKGSLFGFGL